MDKPTDNAKLSPERDEAIEILAKKHFPQLKFYPELLPILQEAYDAGRSAHITDLERERDELQRERKTVIGVAPILERERDEAIAKRDEFYATLKLAVERAEAAEASLAQYKSALENHLCPDDIADWLACPGDHKGNCIVCHDVSTEVALAEVTHSWEMSNDIITKLEASLAQAQKYSIAALTERDESGANSQITTQTRDTDQVKD